MWLLSYAVVSGRLSQDLQVITNGNSNLTYCKVKAWRWGTFRRLRRYWGLAPVAVCEATWGVTTASPVRSSTATA